MDYRVAFPYEHYDHGMCDAIYEEMPVLVEFSTHLFPNFNSIAHFFISNANLIDFNRKTKRPLPDYDHPLTKCCKNALKRAIHLSGSEG